MPDLETLANLCKRRGFVFPSSEIYGGFGGFWDYGPLGVELKRNIKDAWWRAMVQDRDDIVGVDASIVMNPKVWEASGHVSGFTDPLVDCKQCKRRSRVDELKEGRCPYCGGEVTDVRQFNLMFQTYVGPVQEDAAVAYLRPETAQGIFVNFKNVQSTTRKKLPFGIAQIGKSFRNEITPGRWIFRDREFEQMEMEFFVRPGTDDEWHERWIQARWDWYRSIGIRAENLRRYVYPEHELAHYSKATTDLEYRFPWGWAELEGIANRTDFDLTAHSGASGEAMSYFDDETNERITPYVIEPAVGVDRIFLIALMDAYAEEEVRGETRTVLRLHKRLAPYKVAVLPLSRKETITPLAREVAATLRRDWMITYDDSQAIGRRYRRQDEIGTPFCVTIDFDSLDDKRATIRDRDTMEQERVPIEELVPILQEKLR